MVSNILKDSNKKTARVKRIVEMRGVGLTYDEIGLEFGLSRERVRQLYMSRNMNNKNTNNNLKPPRWLKTGDVALLVNVHVSTVRRWADQGTLKSYRVGPRSDRRFKQEDVNSLFKETKLASLID